jgi:hypothetical protein
MDREAYGYPAGFEVRAIVIYDESRGPGVRPGRQRIIIDVTFDGHMTFLAFLLLTDRVALSTHAVSIQGTPDFRSRYFSLSSFSSVIPYVPRPPELKIWLSISDLF